MTKQDLINYGVAYMSTYFDFTEMDSVTSDMIQASVWQTVNELEASGDSGPYSKMVIDLTDELDREIDYWVFA